MKITFESFCKKILDPPKPITESSNEHLTEAWMETFESGTDRYTVTLSFYLNANSDEEIKSKAERLKEDLNRSFDCQTKIESIDSTPFASADFRKVL